MLLSRFFIVSLWKNDGISDEALEVSLGPLVDDGLYERDDVLLPLELFLQDQWHHLFDRDYVWVR